MTSTNIRDFITSTETQAWQPLVEPGVNTAGIFVKPLRRSPDGKRAPSILLKFEAGAHYPYHNHPAGEELLVLQGTCVIEGEVLDAGDYLYTPSNYKHSVTTTTGCILFLSIPEEVQIL